MQFRFWLFVLGLVFWSGCKPGPGSSCHGREARCLDLARAIVCDGDTFIETPCRGKAGCSSLGERTSCDISGNQPGDPCSHADEGVAVCSAATSMLACRGGKYQAVPCHGPKGCGMVGDQANCDQSVAEPGDACKKEGAKACSLDKKQVLACQNSAMAPLYFCRGEAGCSAELGKLSCDQTVAKLGDRCDKGLTGHIACSEDKKALIVCQNEEFMPSEKCKAGTACTVSGQSTRCEKP